MGTNMEDNRDNQYFDLDSLQERPTAEPISKNPAKGLFFGGIAVGVAISLLFASIVYLGVKIQTLTEAKRDAGKEVVFEEGSVVTPQLVKKLQQIEAVINKYYYFDKVSDEEIIDGIYSGMVDSLGDRYTMYLDLDDTQDRTEDMAGSFYGIGVYVIEDSETPYIRISSVIEDSPAEAVGLMPDDLICAADGTSLEGLSLSEAVSLIKGMENTEVVLTIYRESAGGYMEVPVVRAQVNNKQVTFRMQEDNIAYIRIIGFSEVTIDQFTDALATAKGSGMEGLILDLRGNPGGTLDSVLEIARQILPEGLIAYMEDRAGNRREFTCDGERELNVPLVVLVDGNSASASEFLAGAIRDHEKGTLVGTTTFGKGIAQSLIDLRDGTAISITTEGYFLPKGDSIHGIGIEPDVVVPFDGEAYYNSNGEVDNQLDKAIEVLKEKMNQ